MPPWCVCWCERVSLCRSCTCSSFCYYYDYYFCFFKSKHWTPNQTVWQHLAPPAVTLPHVCPVSINDGTEERLTHSRGVGLLLLSANKGVKKPRQLSAVLQKWPWSDSEEPEEQSNPHRDGGMPNVQRSLAQTLPVPVQTYSCNFTLESLWIPGTSILKIQYIQIKLWNFINMWRYCMYRQTVPCSLVCWR